MLDWTRRVAVERQPGRVSGAWVFRSTRVPVSALFASLEGGATVGEFLEWFPGESREEVNGVLALGKRYTPILDHVTLCYVPSDPFPMPARSAAEP
jgi:uncharacterized protein (DUF433 family)